MRTPWAARAHFSRNDTKSPWSSSTGGTTPVMRPPSCSIELLGNMIQALGSVGPRDHLEVDEDERVLGAQRVAELEQQARLAGLTRAKHRAHAVRVRAATPPCA